MRRLLVGSGNAKKKAEIVELLEGLPFQVVGPADLDPSPPPPEESGTTFDQNAREKALAYASATGLMTLADDSGLEVDALGGRPGIYSARYSGPGATDESNNALLLKELQGVEAGHRTARYVAAVALAIPGEILLEARGTCEGRILESPRGDGGFGYDPLFHVPELGRTFAEIPSGEKARLSHRGAALRIIRERLPGLPGALPTP